MTEFNARALREAATAPSATGTPRQNAVPRTLTAAAEAAAAEPLAQPLSPIVVAGAVRMAEFTLIMLIGVAIQLCYLVPIEGFSWRYVGATGGIALMAMLAFQTADI